MARFKLQLPRFAQSLLGQAAAILLAIGATAAPVMAQDYPNRPVRIVVPYAAGGTADSSARLIAQRLTARMGQPVTVENKPGAGGTVGLKSVLAAPADGYTITLLASGYEWLPVMYTQLNFDPLTDFTPVAMIGSAPYIFITHPGRPYKSLADFIRHAKTNQGKTSYATAGMGTLHHLLGTLLQSRAEIAMTAIPYGGAAPAEAALLGGHVDVMFDPIGMATNQVKGQKVTPLASTGPRRSASLPDVPTFEELGVPLRASFWLGLAVRAGVDAAIVKRLNQEINAVLREPALRDRFNDMALEVDPRTPEDFGKFLQEGATSWQAIVRASGLKPQ